MNIDINNPILDDDDEEERGSQRPRVDPKRRRINPQRRSIDQKRREKTTPALKDDFFSNPILDDDDDEEDDLGLPDLSIEELEAPRESKKSFKLIDPSDNDDEYVESLFEPKKKTRERESIPAALPDFDSSEGLPGLERFDDKADYDPHADYEERAHNTDDFIDDHGTDDPYEEKERQAESQEAEPEEKSDLEKLMAGEMTLDIQDDDEEPKSDDSDSDSFSAFFDVPEDDEDAVANFSLDAVLAKGIEIKASDVHISPNDYIAYTILGDIVRDQSFGFITPAITRSILQDNRVISNVLEEDFVQELELDTSYTIRTGKHKGRRFRVSVGRTFGSSFFVFRVIPDSVPEPEKLGVHGALLEWTQLPNGLVMMNGPTGTGKALRLDTKLPTPTGSFITMGEVQIGDTLLDSQGYPTQVTALSEISYHPKLYRLTFSDGQEIYADRNHQWIVTLLTGKNKELPGIRARRENGLKDAKKLEKLSEELDIGYFTLSEILEEVKKRHLNTEFPTRELAELALEFVGCKEVYKNTYDMAEVLKSLSERLYERYRTLSESTAVYTTDELIALQELNNGNLHYGFTKVINDTQSQIILEEIEEISENSQEYAPVRCIKVDSVDSSYLCEDGIVTHNSTTLASLLKKIQLTRSQKIITIERPIEFVFGTEGKALVTQREVGKDARTFAQALTSAMRQAPDIIMIGEVRNKIEVDALLRAAETGHLAISTMHTNSAPATINRIKSLYDGDDQVRVLGSLSDVARGFANQVLVKTTDGKGRFAVREVLPVDEEVANLILKGDVSGMKKYQMVNEMTMEHELVKAVIDGNCTRENARLAASNPILFDKLLKKKSGF